MKKIIPILLVIKKNNEIQYSIRDIPPTIYIHEFLKMLDPIPAKEIQTKELSN
jgi:hypothetical protein